MNEVLVIHEPNRSILSLLWNVTRRGTAQKISDLEVAVNDDGEDGSHALSSPPQCKCEWQQGAGPGTISGNVQARCACLLSLIPACNCVQELDFSSKAYCRHAEAEGGGAPDRKVEECRGLQRPADAQSRGCRSFRLVLFKLPTRHILQQQYRLDTEVVVTFGSWRPTLSLSRRQSACSPQHVSVTASKTGRCGIATSMGRLEPT